MSASSRPTGTTARRVVDEVDDGSAALLGRAAVVTVPAGLCRARRSKGRELDAAAVEPRRGRARSTKVFSCPGSPLTVTRPALISSSAPRREATGPRQEGVQPSAPATIAASLGRPPAGV